MIWVPSIFRTPPYLNFRPLLWTPRAWKAARDRRAAGRVQVPESRDGAEDHASSGSPGMGSTEKWSFPEILSGAKRREWGNDPYNYEFNNPSTIPIHY